MKSISTKNLGGNQVGFSESGAYHAGMVMTVIRYFIGGWEKAGYTP